VRFAGALLALAGVAHAGDLVVLSDGRAVGAANAADPPVPADFAASNVTVLEENLTGVVYVQKDAPVHQTLPRAQVRAVLHDPATTPPDLAAARALVASGKLAEARTRWAKLADNIVAPAWARTEALFRRAESFFLADELEAAVRELGTFQQECSRSRFVLDAKRLRAQALAELGRAADARVEFGAAAGLPGVSDEERATLQFLAAWVDVAAALRAGDARAAQDALRPVAALRSAPDVQRTAVPARCDAVRAAVLVASGKDADAADAAGELVRTANDPFALAVANVVLGDVARRRGSRADLDEALERYLRTALVHRDAEGASEFVAAAGLRAGDLFLELGAKDGNAVEAAVRARREWEEVVRRFPRTDGAKRARAALAKLP
jgi:hypothetical protein